MATPTIRNTKQAIWDAYQAAVAELRQRQAQKPDTKDDASLPDQEQAAALKMPGLLSVEQVAGNIAELKLRLSAALNNLSDQLTEEVGTLQDIRAQVAREKEELEEVYKIKAGASALLELLELHEIKKAGLAKEAAEAEARVRLDTEQKKRLWAREEEDYNYTLAFKRKKEADEYALKGQQRERVFSEGLAEREKALAERESSLAEKKEEFEALGQKIAAFPQELQKSTTEAREQLRQELTAQSSAAANLTAKDVERENSLAKLKIQSLEETVKNQTRDIERLESQLAQATQKAQELALTIIEARREPGPKTPEPREEKKSE